MCTPVPKALGLDTTQGNLGWVSWLPSPSIPTHPTLPLWALAACFLKPSQLASAGDGDTQESLWQ